MTKWIIAAVAAAAVAAGGFLFLRGSGDAEPDDSAKAPAVAAADAGARVTPPAPVDPDLAPPTALSLEQERHETEVVANVASELELDGAHVAEVHMALAEMQAGRRKLFDDLAAGRVTTEQVSAGLRQLRSAMYARLEKAVGAEKTAKVRERLRAEHGYVPAPPPP